MVGESNLRCWLVTLMLLLLMPCISAMGKIIYVDDDAAGVNRGTSWANAYTFLQDALADANFAEKPVEIRVAQGIYTPDQGAGVTRGDKGAAFQLINDVTVLGGFAGIGVAEPDARNIEEYVTILSGDLAEDDVDIEDPKELSTHPTRAENSSTVVRGDETDQTAVLDGVTITAGSTGLSNGNGSPYVNKCTFTNTQTGIFNLDSSQRLTGCTFSGNSNLSRFGGSALSLEEGGQVSNCIFWDNIQPAIDSRQSEPFVRYCDVQGGWPGEGNIDVDPYFVSPGYWDQNGTPEDTTDDFWVDGDYHLKSQAGRWGPVSESWVIDDITSPCIDAGDPLTPVMYEPHPRGYYINMGAYGGTETASKSYIN